MSSTYQPTKVYLVVDPVIRRGGGISEQTQSWYRAKWIARGSGTVMYTSKLCGALKSVDAVFAARALAEKWLAKQNARPSRMGNILAAEEWAGPRFEDTTGNPRDVQ